MICKVFLSALTNMLRLNSNYNNVLLVLRLLPAAAIIIFISEFHQRNVSIVNVSVADMCAYFPSERIHKNVGNKSMPVSQS